MLPNFVVLCRGQPLVIYLYIGEKYVFNEVYHLFSVVARTKDDKAHGK